MSSREIKASKNGKRSKKYKKQRLQNPTMSDNMVLNLPLDVVELFVNKKIIIIMFFDVAIS